MLVVLGLLFTTVVSSCGSTVNGGAESTSAAAVPPVTLPTTNATTILESMCEELQNCNPSLSLNTCEYYLLQQTNVDTALGLPSGFGTFQQVITAEQNSQITVNANNFSSCLSALNDQACSDNSVIDSYNTSSPNDFSNAYNLIPTSAASMCAQVY
jgi:hypothetical protein